MLLTPARSGGMAAVTAAAAACAGRTAALTPTAPPPPLLPLLPSAPETTPDPPGCVLGRMRVFVVTPGMPKPGMPVDAALRTTGRGALSSRHISSTLLFGRSPSAMVSGRY